MQVLSIGEVLWDVFPEQEFLGGAPLNFSANISRLGDAVALITAVGEDARGKTALRAMQSLGLSTEFVDAVRHRATGAALISTSPEGEPRFEIPRPAAFDAVSVTPEKLRAVQRLSPDWLYFGTLIQTEPGLEAATQMLMSKLPGVRGFYDMNLRTGHWNLPLVQRLCGMASVLKLNEFEAKILGESAGIAPDDFSLEAFCRMWARDYRLDIICITLGGAGCCVFENGETHTVPGYPTRVQDTVGAGDAFAAAFLHGYHRGWPVTRTARFANALGSIVASRAGATPAWTIEECLTIAAISPVSAMAPVASMAAEAH